MAQASTATASPHEPELVDEHQLADIERKAATGATALAQRVAALVIDSPEKAQAAADIRAEIVARRKAIEGWFAEPIAAAHALHKSLTTRRAKALAPYAEPENAIKRSLADWQIAEERRAAEAERERQRQIAEARRKAEAEAEAAREIERKRLEEEQLALAAEAEQAGDMELAERIVSAPTPEPTPAHVEIPEPIAPPPVVAAKVEGVTFVTKYRAEVIDFAALVRAAAERPEWRKLLAVDQVALNKMASALGDALAVPGVRVIEDRVLRSARGA